MLTCPHCNQPGVTVLRKMLLGPVFPTKCKTCGEKVGVPYGKSLAAVAVMLPAFIAIAFRAPPVVMVSLAIVGAVVACVLYRYWVPLEARS